MQGSVQQRKPEKIVAAVRQMLPFSYHAFTVSMDIASTEQAKQLISLQQQTAHSEWWGEHTAGFIDMHRTTLCLIGRVGTQQLLMRTGQTPETLQFLLGRRYDRLRAMTCML